MSCIVICKGQRQANREKQTETEKRQEIAFVSGWSSSLVCDALARALLKNVKGHNAYFGCEKCETEGDWYGMVTNQDTDSQRTDKRFNEMVNEEHHLGPPPLKPLSMGMVTHFLLDYMHCVCLSVMRLRTIEEHHLGPSPLK